MYMRPEKAVAGIYKKRVFSDNNVHIYYNNIIYTYVNIKYCTAAIYLYLLVTIYSDFTILHRYLYIHTNII